MTDAEWLASDDPGPMLFFLRDATGKSKGGRRKIRLLMAAGCRQAWDRFGDSSRVLIEASESYADGSLSYRDFRAAWDAVFETIQSGAEGAHLACMASHYQIWAAAVDNWMTRLADGATLKLREQTHLIRDVFGLLPFRRAVADASIRTRDVGAMAEAAYAERALPSGHLESARLAVLADALEDAGASGDLLEHLRSPGPHIRGCWAVDLCLGLI
jgi:hypothetical protein